MMRILIWATLIVFSFNASAATFNVSTAIELRAALSGAAANGEDDTIVVSDGIIKTTDDGKGTFVYLSQEANTLIIGGSSSDKAILSGGGVDQILQHTSTEDAVLKLRNLSFIDGYTTGNGGAVQSSYGASVTSCKFQNNRAENLGGAIYNNAAPVSGAAIDVFVMDVQDTLFDNNIAAEGGGFYTRTANVVDSVFTNNESSGAGGGFYVWTNEGGSKNTILRSILENNLAGTRGGGFYSSSPTEVTESTFRSNSAPTGGGFYAGSISVSESRIIDNRSSQTGAGFSTSPGHGGSAVTNSYISGNVNSNELDTYVYCGGGFYARNVELINTVMLGNSSLIGGTFCSQSRVKIYNSLFGKNSTGIQVTNGSDNYIFNSVFLNYSGEILSDGGLMHSRYSQLTTVI